MPLPANGWHLLDGLAADVLFGIGGLRRETALLIAPGGTPTLTA